MNLAEITGDVITALSDLGYFVVDALPGATDLPAAIVDFPDSITYHRRMAGGEEIQLTVTVIVAHVDTRDAKQRLAAALSTESVDGIDVQPLKPALESATGAWRTLAVTSADSFGTYSVGQTSGLGARLHLTIAANRAGIGS